MTRFYKCLSENRAPIREYEELLFLCLLILCFEETKENNIDDSEKIEEPSTSYKSKSTEKLVQLNYESIQKKVLTSEDIWVIGLVEDVETCEDYLKGVEALTKLGEVSIHGNSIRDLYIPIFSCYQGYIDPIR